MKTPKPIVEIAGMGHFLPEKVVTNDDLTKIVETSDEWIRERTGIRERRIASPEEGATEMGAEAARRAMAQAGVRPGEIDILIVSTATPDRLLPSTACDIQAAIGAHNALAFDICAACSGWLYALSLAEGYLATGRGEIALVIAAEKMSSIVDWTDRSTCVLFGDGAGAAVLKPSNGERGILSSHHGSDGELADLLYRPGGGARIPIDEDVLARRDHLVKMAGREVFKAAVRAMAQSSDKALEAAGLTGGDIAWLVPHQANIRIIEATAKYSGIPMDQVYVNVDRYGNMSSATIPVALSEMADSGQLQPGANLLFAAFGAGFTWGAMTYRW